MDILFSKCAIRNGGALRSGNERDRRQEEKEIEIVMDTEFEKSMYVSITISISQREIEIRWSERPLRKINSRREKNPIGHNEYLCGSEAEYDS